MNLARLADDPEGMPLQGAIGVRGGGEKYTPRTCPAGSLRERGLHHPAKRAIPMRPHDASARFFKKPPRIPRSCRRQAEPSVAGGCDTVSGAPPTVLYTAIQTLYCMFLVAHLLSGLILGLLLSRRDPRFFLPAIIGAILPDLIDKPVGHILLADSLNYGRLLTHGLWVALMLLILGIVYLKSHPALFGLSLGVILHQILDGMWFYPANWLFPLLGPFVGEGSGTSWVQALLRELTNPFEWLFFMIVAVVLGYIYQETLRRYFIAFCALFNR